MELTFDNSLLLPDVVIGFEHTHYSVSESMGQIKVTVMVVAGVLTSNISYVVSTSDGTAIGE